MIVLLQCWVGRDGKVVVVAGIETVGRVADSVAVGVEGQ